MSFKQVLINNVDPIREPGEAASPSDLERGEVAIFNADFTNGNLNLTEAAAGEQFYIVQGVGDGEQPLMSPLINKAKVKRVVKTEYRAPAKQVTDIEVTSNEEGDTYIKFVRVDKEKPHKRYTFQVTAADGDTVEDIVDKAVDAINANKAAFVEAEKEGTDTIRVTSKYFDLSFRTAIEGEGEDWEVTAETTPDRGTGTYEHVKDMEFRAGGTYSDYYRIWFPMDVPRYADPNLTYDLYSIELETTTTPNIAKANNPIQIQIAVDAGVQQDTNGDGNGDTDIDLETFFGLD